MSLHEVNIMKQLPQHPNIVKFYGSEVGQENQSDVVLIL